MFSDAFVFLDSFDDQPDHYAPFFETTIRYLGGALSAYALSKEPALLERADELGKILLPAFIGTSSGLPAYSVHVETCVVVVVSNFIVRLITRLDTEVISSPIIISEQSCLRRRRRVSSSSSTLRRSRGRRNITQLSKRL